MKIIDCIQGSDEWWQARKGRPTASEFGRFINASGDLSRAKSGKGLSQGATTYASELLAESTGWVKNDFKGSPDITRGNQLEDMARKFLAFELGEDIEEVGFCLSDCGRYGASPDGLINGKTPIELKCPDQHTQIRYLMNGGGLPPDYKAQVHGQMVVTGADYSWFCAYVSSFEIPNILLKIERDDFTKKVEKAVEEFCDELENHRAQVFGREAA